MSAGVGAYALYLGGALLQMKVGANTSGESVGWLAVAVQLVGIWLGIESWLKHESARARWLGVLVHAPALVCGVGLLLFPREITGV